MRTFEEALYDIYDRAKERQIIERRRKKRLMTIAATCATLSVVVVLSAVYVWRPWNDGKTPDDRVVLEGTNGDKKWISDIPGAVYIENPEYYFAGPNPSAIPMNRNDVVDFLRSKPMIVVGEVENIHSFYIDYKRFENGYYSYYITTFDIKVTQDIRGTIETSTLKCVTSIDSFRLDDNPNHLQPTVRCGISDIGRQIIDNPSGLFVLENTENDIWELGSKNYNVSEYADYYVTNKYNCNYNSINWSGYISFNEIRYTPDVYYTSKEGANARLWKLEDGFEFLDDLKLFGKSRKWIIKEKANDSKTVDGFGTFKYKESEFVDGYSVLHPVKKVYETYATLDNSMIATFFQDTDVMTYFCNNNIVQTGEKIDELKAKEIADDFLKKYIKIDPDVNRYLLEGFQISVESLTLGTFTVSYVKCIEGLPTDEVLTVCVSEYGQICSYDGRNIRQYINNDHIISKEKINDAQERLENALNKKNLDYSIGENKYLATDSNGKVYLSVTVEVKNGNDVISQQMYVPVFYIPQ